MALYGRDANGNDAYIRGTGSGAVSLGYLTFHDVFSDEVKFVSVALASGTASADLVAAVATQKIRVLSYTVSSDSACSIKFDSGASVSTVSQDIYLAANGSLSTSSELGLFESTAGEKLVAVVTGSANVSVTISYREV